MTLFFIFPLFYKVGGESGGYLTGRELTEGGLTGSGLREGGLTGGLL